MMNTVCMIGCIYSMAIKHVHRHCHCHCHACEHGEQVIQMQHMMTSSNGNIFPVTGPLGGKSTGDRWISLKRASDAELWCFQEIWNMSFGNFSYHEHRSHLWIASIFLFFLYNLSRNPIPLSQVINTLFRKITISMSWENYQYRFAFMHRSRVTVCWGSVVNKQLYGI